MTPEQIEIPEAFEKWLKSQLDKQWHSSGEITKEQLEIAHGVAYTVYRHLSIHPASQTYPRWVRADERLPEKWGTDGPIFRDIETKKVLGYGDIYSPEVTDPVAISFKNSLSDTEYRTQDDLILSYDCLLEWLSEDPAPKVVDKPEGDNTPGAIRAANALSEMEYGAGESPERMAYRKGMLDALRYTAKPQVEEKGIRETLVDRFNKMSKDNIEFHQSKEGAGCNGAIALAYQLAARIVDEAFSSPLPTDKK